MDRLDPRLETLEVTAGTNTPSGTPVTDDYLATSDRPSPVLRHEAFVLLQPGRNLPEIVTAAFRCNETTYLVEEEVDKLRSLAAHPAVVYVEAPRPMGEDLDRSVPETRANLVWMRPGGPLSGAGVIVGIIDTGGLDWKLKDFQVAPPGNLPATRILAIWDQTLTAQGNERPPAGFNDGVEYDRAAIDADLHGGTALRHQVSAGSHASHVAGIAAGNGASHAGSASRHAHPATIGVAHKAELIYVELKSDPTTTLTNSASLVRALEYVFRKAGDKPCAINVSLGNNGGAHDSESVVERTIDRMLEAHSRVLVKSAGNEGSWNCHASGTLTKAYPTRTLHWQVGRPNRPDRTPNEMEIWYSARDRLTVTVTAPDGRSSGPQIPGPQSLTRLFHLNGESVSISTQRFHELNGAAYIFIKLKPLVPYGSLRPGVWQVALTAANPQNIVDGRFHAWIERDRRDRAYGFADQSIFVNGTATTDCTISPPGTIRRGLTVGNFDHHTRAAAASSSRGRTRDERTKPDLSAPGVDVWSSGANGVAGGVPDTRVPMSGTSMAAPHVTGVCALLLQLNGNLSSAQLGSALIAAAAGPANFDPQLGLGQIDADEATGMLS